MNIITALLTQPTVLVWSSHHQVRAEVAALGGSGLSESEMIRVHLHNKKKRQSFLSFAARWRKMGARFYDEENNLLD